MIGARNLIYEAGQVLCVSVEMPVLGRVARASQANPFLGVTLELDPAVFREVFSELDSKPIPPARPALSAFVVDLDGSLLDCIGRALALLDTPKAVPILYRSIAREICYRLLTGPHRDEISKFALSGNRTHRVVNAIYFLRDNFAKPVRMEDLAKTAGMSPASFYQHFRIHFGESTPVSEAAAAARGKAADDFGSHK